MKTDFDSAKVLAFWNQNIVPLSEFVDLSNHYGQLGQHSYGISYDQPDEISHFYGFLVVSIRRDGQAIFIDAFSDGAGEKAGDWGLLSRQADDITTRMRYLSQQPFQQYSAPNK